MPCLEKVGLVQAHFSKYTPFYALWTYSSLFCYLDPKSEPKLFTNMFLSFKKTRRKNSWCSSLCQVLLLVRFVWYLVGSWLDCWDDCSQCELSLESLVIFLATWIVSCPPSWREFDLYHAPQVGENSTSNLKLLQITYSVCSHIKYCEVGYVK